MKKGIRDRVFTTSTTTTSSSITSSIDSPTTSPSSISSEPASSKASLWSGFVASAYSIFESHGESSSSSSAPASCEKKETFNSRNNGWRAAVKRLVAGGAMRRIQERVMGPSKTGIANSTSDIWFLGICYKISPEETSEELGNSNGLAAFEQDFSSRILMTYRKGFSAIEDSKYTSDVNWGCMLRSSQMLVAQALLFHRLGRSWRKPLQKPMDQDYIEILQLFGDTEASPFSIHNLLQAGKAYGLAAGSWVGPYAMCRSWETLARCKRDEFELGAHSLSMAVHIVSGDEDGERGGAPVVCIEDASRHCFEFSKGEASWTPILLLVPLVLGLEKVNPRYIPLLGATFTFPQSIGILGGKPGASTYIVGVQDEKAFYLDPHEVQPVVDISRDNMEVDTSSYHCNVIRHIPLDSIDSSLAIGFYCRDKDDFDDFCSRASKLAENSNGAPLFTVVETRKLPKPANNNNMMDDSDTLREDESYDVVPMSEPEGHGNEDDWQLL